MNYTFTRCIRALLLIIVAVATFQTGRAQYTLSTVETGGAYTAVATDASNNLYTTKLNSNTGLYDVVRFSGGTGTPTVILSSLDHGTAIQLDNPRGLAVSANGDVYVLTSFGANGGSILKLSSPSYSVSYLQTGRYFTAIAIDNRFDFLYTMEYDSTTKKYDVVRYPPYVAFASGTKMYEGLAVPAAGTSYPAGLATDSYGSVYFTDFLESATHPGGAILKINVAGSNLTTVATGKEFSSLAVDNSNNLYALAATSTKGVAQIIRYSDETGNTVPINSTLTISDIFYPAGLSVDGNGTIYAGDGPAAGNGRLIKIAQPMVRSVKRGTAAPITNNTTVDFVVTFTAPVSGVSNSSFSQYFVTGGSVSSVSQVNDTTYNVIVNTGTGNGSLALYVYGNSITPALGNTPYRSGESYTIDKIAPVISLAINGGAAGTNAAAVSLTETATDAVGYLQMRFSADSSTWTDYETFAASKAYTLATGDGAKKVYMQVKDSAGNVSGTSATITLDQTGPVVTFGATPASITNQTSATFSFTADEAVAGYEASFDGDTYHPVTAPLSFTGLSDGAHTLEVRATDLFSNTGAPASYTWNIDNTAPTVQNVTYSAAGTYHIGQVITLTANMSEAVYSDNTGGVPYINMTIGSTVAKALYTGGAGTNTWTFAYTVQEGDLDNDGIVLDDAVRLNRNVLTDGAGNVLDSFYTVAASGIKVNGIRPVATLSAPAAANTTTLTATLGFDVAVTGVNVASLSLSGITGATVTGVTPDAVTSTTSYTITITLPADSKGTLHIALAADVATATQSGNTNTAAGADVDYDNTAPVVTGVSVPVPAYYREGNNLDFAVTFDKVITVSAGNLYVPVTIGSTVVHADYVSGSGTNELTFRYTVASGDNDDNGIEVGSALTAAAGVLKDGYGNDAVTTLNNVGVTNGVFVNTVIPSVSLSASQTFVNSVFPVTVSFSEVVSGLATGDFTMVNGTAGNIQTTDHITYTVDVTPLAEGAVKITLPANTVMNVGGNANTASNEVVVTADTTAPVVTGVSVPADGYYHVGDELNFTVNFSEEIVLNVTTENPYLKLNLTSGTVQAVYVGKSGNNGLNFKYTVVAGDADADGIGLAGAVELDNLSVKDKAGNHVNVTLAGVPVLTGVKVNTTHPTVNLSATTNPVNAPFIVTATFSEAVTGLTAAGFTVTNGTAGNLATTNNITYTFTVTPLADGNVTVSLPADAAVNVGNNGNAVSNTLTVSADLTAPVITTVSVPAAGYYKSGSLLNFAVSFGEVVNVTGTPQIAIAMGSDTVYATYFSGTGTSTLIFTYVVVNGDQDLDGIEVGALSGGNIKDAAGNAALLSFTAPSTTGVLVNTIAPVITSVSVPAGAYYHAGQTLDFSVQFSAIVNVSGTPVLPITIGSTTVFANYVSGSGTAVLNFSHTVVDGENDLDGIEISDIMMSGATIQDAFTNNAVLTLHNAGSTSGVFVYTTHPTVALSGAASLVNGAFEVTATFSEAVTGLTAGNFTVVNGTVSNLVSTNNITYTITVTPSADGNVTITLPADAAVNIGNNGNTASNTLTVTADLTAPVITTVSVPAVGYYKAGSVLNFTVSFGEVVNVTGTPQMAIIMGSDTVYATYGSGTGTSTLSFSYTVVNGDQDLDGIAVGAFSGGSIKDAAGNTALLTFTAPSTAGVFVNTIAPVVLQVDVPSAGYYHAGQILNFSAQFSALIHVTGTPVLPITIGSTIVNANYISGSGTAVLNFSYTVLDGENDLDGITLSAITGTIQDLYGNEAVKTLHNTGNTTGVYVYTDKSTVALTTGTALVNGAFEVTATFSEKVTGLTAADFIVTNGTAGNLVTTDSITYTFDITPASDGNITVSLPADVTENKGANGNTASNMLTVSADLTAPVITSVSVPAAGHYKSGSVLNFTVSFGEVVNVTGTPQMAITMGSSTVYADYTGGTGTSTLNYSYTVLNGDQDLDGIAVGALSNGSIKDAAGNGAVLSFTAPSTTGVLVNTIAPVITQVSVPANAYYHAGQTLDFAVQFSTIVNVTGTPVLPVTIGSTIVNAGYTAGSGTNILSFRYTVQDGENDLDGIALADITGTIQDVFTNNAVLTLNNVGSTAGVFVYTVHPTVTVSTSVTNVNTAYTVTATFSEAVTGLTATDFTVTNGTASNLVSTDSITYTLTITPSADGNVTVSLPIDAAVNKGDNGNTASNTVTVLSDITAPVITSGQTFSVDEYSAAGTTVGTINAVEAIGTLQNWTITNDPSGAFAINATTGVFSVKDEAALNASTNTTVSLTITVSDGANISIATTVDVTVVYVPLPPTDINLDNQILVENMPAQTLVGHLSGVTAEPNPVYTYTLVTGTGSADNSLFTIADNQLLTNAVLDYAVKNLYTVRIRATLGNGLYTEKAFTIQIGQVNQAPTLNPVADQEVCAITTAQTIQTSGASAVEADQILSYTVSADQPFFTSLEVTANGLITYHLQPNVSGTVHVTVTVKDNGGTAYGGVDTLAQTFAIKVNALPVITISADQDTVISKGTAMNLTATGGVNYEWSNASGIVDGQQTATLQIKPVENTLYTVTVTDNNGCINEGAMMITVVNEFKIDAINLLTPNGDGKNDKWIINDLSRYPNNELTIYDRSGRVVYHTRNYSNEWDATYNGSPLAEGTYYYILKAEGYTTPAKGFITIIRDQH